MDEYDRMFISEAWLTVKDYVLDALDGDNS